MVVSLAFVNSSHYWVVIKRFPPCSTSAPLFAWLGFVPFLGGLDWRPWADSSIVIFCYCPSYTRPFYTLYDILLRHISTLYFCGYDWLSSMDPSCSFVAMTTLDLIWRLFAYWVTMIVSSVIHMLDPLVYLWRLFVYGLVCPRDQFCLTFISLSGTFVWSFWSWILCSLHTHFFPFYNVFWI